MWSRRAFVLSAFGLTACGFQPLNSYRASADGDRATAALSAVSVNPIRDRNGQILRNALLDRLDPRGAAQYRLIVEVEESIGEGLLSRDSSATRRTLMVVARFNLTDMNGRTVLAGVERADSRYDVVRQVENAFADVAGEQAARRRVSDEVADRIVRRLGFAFARESL